MLVVSTVECVQALTLAGFHIVAQDSEHIVLACGLRRVTVPHALLLDSDVLERVLQEAEIAYADFLELLARAFPEPGNADVAATGVRRRHGRETG